MNFFKLIASSDSPVDRFSGTSSWPGSTAQGIADAYMAFVLTRPIVLPPAVAGIVARYLVAPEAWFDRVKQCVADIYSEFRPMSQYTCDTDDAHYLLVAQNLELAMGSKVPPFLVLAAYLHDLERWLDHDGLENSSGSYLVKKLGDLVPSCDARRQDLDNLDESFRKRDIHPVASMRLAQTIMNACEVPPDIQELVSSAIRFHDTKPSDLCEDKVKSLFPGLSLPFPDLKVAIEALMQADALVFFQTTVGIFLKDRFHDPKMSDSKLEERLLLNFEKVGPVLAQAAFDYGTDSIDIVFKKLSIRHDDSGFDEGLGVSVHKIGSGCISQSHGKGSGISRAAQLLSAAFSKLKFSS